MTQLALTSPAYYDGKADGLRQTWAGGRVWCNPPFSDIEPWIERAWDSHAELVVMMIPATRTDQPFWQKWVEPHRDKRWSNWDFRTRFLPGRIRFGHPGNPEGVGVGSPMFGCVLLIWTAM